MPDEVTGGAPDPETSPVGEDSEPTPTSPALAPAGQAGVTFARGQVLGERYWVHGLLGRGGMGEVWKAFDLKLHVEVALKSVRQADRSDPEALDRLRREVRSARKVISPNVCRVFDVVAADGHELISMEYIDGQTLFELLRSKGALDLKKAGEFAAQFLAGLEAIHRAGLVHRDLKPGNVMLSGSGRVVVMDFGIAKAVAGTQASGVMAGTPGYIAPEVARGGTADARSDVYAAGLVLLEMISSGGVGDRAAREALWKGVSEDPPRLPGTPWDAVLCRALAADPERRYDSAQTLARALEEAVLRFDGADDRTPYPGLSSFTESEREFFFGREAEVEAVWKKLHRRSLLALVGPSGAGKSSFLRAGLLPAAPEGWRCVICQPGDAPFVCLAQALSPELSGDTEAVRQLVRFEDVEVALSVLARWRQRHTEVLLIVDQFEELFTLNSGEGQSRFSEVLGRAAAEAGVHVLLSMRDDFLFRCHAHLALEPIVNELTLLGPPEGAALRRALVQPALRCGYRFEDEALVAQMLAEVTDERGALPLLAFAAASLWEARDRTAGLLTLRAYEQIGGVGGSLAQHAEATLERVGSEREGVVREIFRNLVTAEGTRAVRKVEDLLSVFEDREAARHAVQVLVEARLLTSFEVAGRDDVTPGGQRLEIVHESLLSSWPRLVRWLAQDAEGALLRDQLRQAAQVWEARGRPSDLLWTGTAVKEYQLWRERYPGGLTATEDGFARAMVEQAGRSRRRRRLAVAAGVVALLAVLATISTLWRATEGSRREAVSQARRAEASRLVALGRVELEVDPSAAVAHALASLERADTGAARRLAVEALWKGPTAIVEKDAGWNESLDFSPDGQWLAQGSLDGSVKLWSRSGGSPRLLFRLEGTRVGRVRFAPAADVLVSWSLPDSLVRLWSVPDGRAIRTLPVEAVHFSLAGNGRDILTFTPERQRTLVHAWPLDGGEGQLLGSIGSVVAAADSSGSWLAYSEGSALLLRSLEGSALSPPQLIGRHDSRILRVLFLPDGKRLLSGDRSGEFRLWSLVNAWQGSPSGRPPRVVQGHPPAYSLRAVGSLLAVSPGGKIVSLWDLSDPPGADPIEFRRREVTSIYTVAFHPAGHWLATGGSTGVALWPLGPRYSRVLRGHTAMVIGLAFAPDGSWVASAAWDGTLRVWPLEGAGRTGSRVLLKVKGNLLDLVADSKGQSLLVGGEKVRLVPLAGGPPRVLSGFERGAWPVAFDPHGRFAASAGGDVDPREAVVRIWDLESGQTRVLDAGHGKWITDLQFVDGNRLTSGGRAGLRLWNLEDGSSRVLRQGFVWMAAPGPDGRKLLSVGGRYGVRGEAVLHDLKAGGSQPLTSHGERVISVTLDPTGTMAVTGDFDGVVRVGPVSGGPPHVLFGHEGMIWAVAVSPDGRWIASAGEDKTVRLWPMPEGPPFHTLPREELLDRLRALTNMRMVKDEEAPTGYRTDYALFPGWEKVPTW